MGVISPPLSAPANHPQQHEIPPELATANRTPLKHSRKPTLTMAFREPLPPRRQLLPPRILAQSLPHRHRRIGALLRRRRVQQQVSGHRRRRFVLWVVVQGGESEVARAIEGLKPFVRGEFASGWVERGRAWVFEGVVFVALDAWEWGLAPRFFSRRKLVGERERE